MLTNALASEKSPYLRQHMHNPVAWLPWGNEAFARAQSERKPIFLSIGYSTCHWCHVMAHESFENASTAALLNEHFIAVKVDREERPDVDRLYMTFVQLTTGHGGWPMSVWLTPELKPFFGGTYFPPEDRWGRPGFPTLLQRIAEAWSANPEKVSSEGENLAAEMRRLAATKFATTADAELGWEPHQQCFQHFYESFDPQWGGFGLAPKFPRASVFNFLFRIAARRDESQPEKNTEIGDEALKMALSTLQRMAEGGLRDHLGGGFHRYSVDEQWHVPHFEKMLYDQAQLACSYLDAFQATGRETYAWIAREIFSYVRRDLTSPQGAFFSAEDADSTAADGTHGEGAFYVWNQSEIEEICGADAQLVCAHFDVQPGGNVAKGADPHGEFTGKNILRQKQSLAKTASALGLTLADAERRLLAAIERLRETRTNRPRPHLDDKILTSWNGMMIAALARGAQILPEEKERAECLAAAERAAEFLQRELYDPQTKRLWRCWCEGRSAIAGFAEDYAHLIAGLLDLYEASGVIRWLRWASELQESIDEIFWDAENGGYFGSAPDDPSIFVRFKEDYDGAEPAVGSVAAHNALRFAAMFGENETGAASRFRSKALGAFHALRPQWERAAHALPQLLVAMDFALGPVRQIVLAGSPNDPRLKVLQRALHSRLEGARVILWADGAEGQQWLAQRVASLGGSQLLNDQPCIRVCRDFVCQLPTNDASEIARQLG